MTPQKIPLHIEGLPSGIVIDNEPFILWVKLLPGAYQIFYFSITGFRVGLATKPCYSLNEGIDKMKLELKRHGFNE